MIGLLVQAKAFADHRLARAIARGERGQGMVEYGLILGAIAVIGAVALWALGPSVKDALSDANGTFATPTAKP
jgi:Flp pilus assembly pilin Flp